jgi:hypothetical protein
VLGSHHAANAGNASLHVRQPSVGNVRGEIEPEQRLYPAPIPIEIQHGAVANPAPFQQGRLHFHQVRVVLECVHHIGQRHGGGRGAGTGLAKNCVLEVRRVLAAAWEAGNVHNISRLQLLVLTALDA